MFCIPTEILDHILSFLQSDPESLKECSKSHPYISRLAERHLYSEILFRTDGSSSDRRFIPSDFAELLSERSHIAHYIHHLQIYVNARRDTQIYVRHQLEEISKILPKLSSLRRIELDHSSTPLAFQWKTQPKKFRLAFLACLRMPSLRDVSLSRVSNFPRNCLLTDEYKGLKALTLTGKAHGDVAPNAWSLPNARFPFESLCLQDFTGGASEQALVWATTGILQPRSLKFSSDAYELLPKILTNCSTTLTNLYLEIGIRRSYYYDIDHVPPMIEEPEPSVTLAISSMLPRLEELTIHSAILPFKQLHGFYSPIPEILNLFSNKYPSSWILKRLLLDFECLVEAGLGPATSSESPLALSFSNIICNSLIQLLSTISTLSSDTSPSIQVNLFFEGKPLFEKSLESTPLKDTPFPLLLSQLHGSEELKQYFPQ